MQVMAVRGYLPDHTMPAHLKAAMPEVRPFSDVLHTFTGMASSVAQQGTDYDIPNEPPVYDQGDEGSCVLNATCGAANIILSIEKQRTMLLSRNFLYYLCRSQMGTVNEDSGTYTHLAVDRVGKIGVCEEKVWGYSAQTFKAPPPQETYTEASDNKITAWFQILSSGTKRLAELEAAIRANHPVIYGAPVGSAIQSYQAGDILTIPRTSDIIGGHSTVFTGVRYINGQRVWRIRNSWSKDYGDNGHFLIDDAYASWAQLNDLWVLTRVDPLMF